MATKDQIMPLHTQVNAIETELRSMKHTKLHARVADLEEEVFGETRPRRPYTSRAVNSQKCSETNEQPPALPLVRG